MKINTDNILRRVGVDTSETYIITTDEVGYVRVPWDDLNLSLKSRVILPEAGKSEIQGFVYCVFDSNEILI